MAEAADAAPPLGTDDFGAHLAPLFARRPAGLVIAVSGGPDSVALMHGFGLLAARGPLPPIAVATVDHGLRPGSREDAQFVLGEAAALGFSAHLLSWDGPKPVRAIQEKARDARYDLLAGLCARLGADHLLTAHTADDQSETILFRMARGSGPAGLVGMRSFTRLTEKVTQARPLLGVAKARLLASCAAHDWPFRRDPSNEDPRYARTRLRRLLPSLAAEGLDWATMATLSMRLARCEAALDEATDRLATEAVLSAAPDLWSLDMRLLAGRPVEFTIRLIGRALQGLHPGRRTRLNRLEEASLACRAAALAGTPLVRTLHGCVLRLTSGGVLHLSREGLHRRGAGSAASADDPLGLTPC